VLHQQDCPGGTLQNPQPAAIKRNRREKAVAPQDVEHPVERLSRNRNRACVELKAAAVLRPGDTGGVDAGLAQFSGQGVANLAHAPGYGIGCGDGPTGQGARRVRDRIRRQGRKVGGHRRHGLGVDRRDETLANVLIVVAVSEQFGVHILLGSVDGVDAPS
jgi:hypothetical protein